jgi:ribosome-interacting GTPase 1
VKIYGETTLDDVEDAVFERTVYRPAIIVANKTDVSRAMENLKGLEQLFVNRIPIVPISCKTRSGFDKLGTEIFKVLEIIRVYTKEPKDSAPSLKPFILKTSATVADLAKMIHSDFVKRFSHAKVWAKRLVFSPQKVGSTFVLEDKDVVELHAE